MNREVHVRIWERPEVRILRATRRLEPVDRVRAIGRNLRILPVPAGPGKRPFAEPTTAVRRWQLDRRATLSVDLRPGEEGQTVGVAVAVA